MEALEKGTKIVAAAALGAYVLGVVAVSLRLFAVDVAVPDLASFKPRFILTGFLVAVCAIPAACAPYAAFMVAKQHEWKTANAFLTVGWVVILILILGIPFAIPVVLQTETDARGGVSFGELATLYGIALGTAGCVAVAIAGTDDAFLRLFGVSLALVGAAWYLWIFAQHVLPVVPEQFGGIRPKQAQLVLTPEGSTAAIQLGLAVDPGTQRTAALTVLFEGNEYLVVEAEPDRAVQLKKSLVIGSRVDSRRPRPRDVQTRDVTGIPGRAESGDEIQLTFSEPIAPASIADRWDGKPRDVTVRLTAGKDRYQNDVVTVWDAWNNKQLGVGSIDFRGSNEIDNRVITFGTRDRPSRMSADGRRIIVVLGAPSEPVALSRTLMYWNPSTAIRDLAGNKVVSGGVEESDGYDDPKKADAEF